MMVRGWGGGGGSRPDLESEETREEEWAVKDGEMLWSFSAAKPNAPFLLSECFSLCDHAGRGIVQSWVMSEWDKT